MSEMPQSVETMEAFLSDLDTLNTRIRRWARSLPPAEYKRVATYLYWVKTDLAVPQIAEMLGITPANKVNEYIDKRYPFPVQCEICGEEKYVHYNSRKRSKVSEWDRQAFALYKRSDWVKLRTAYINGSFYENFSENGYMPMRNLVEYTAYGQDGICDECRARMSVDFDEIRTLRTQNITHLRTMPYQDYLLSDHWKALRQWAIFAAHYSCQICNWHSPNAGQGLNVHHRTYENRGDESPRDIVVLCENCHHTFHKNGKLAT